jgi:RNA polymerase sigma-70 factor (ECF subfamily)
MDEAGFDPFFRSEYPRVVRTVYLLVHDTELARDIAQDSFLQLYRHWKRVSRYEYPEVWVRRVAIRLAQRTRRRDRMRREKEAAGATHLEVPFRISELLDSIGELSGSQRASVILFYYEDRPIEEIGIILNCSPATVRVHLHRARKRLRSSLREELEVAHAR